VIDQIEKWIFQVNSNHRQERQSCSVLHDCFNGFYSPQLLDSAYFVVTDDIPKPDFPQLRDLGLGDFIDMKVRGVTYHDTYYVAKHAAEDVDLHFHELVHVLQWKELGIQGFITRYTQEILSFGYDNAPLENMAYSLQERFGKNKQHFNVEQFVRDNI